MSILYISAELDVNNPIAVYDVCESIIQQMKALQQHANSTEEVTMLSGNLETVDDELVGDWIIEERRKGRR